jgi:hypothetical protein
MLANLIGIVGLVGAVMIFLKGNMKSSRPLRLSAPLEDLLPVPSGTGSVRPLAAGSRHIGIGIINKITTERRHIFSTYLVVSSSSLSSVRPCREETGISRGR